MEDERLVVQRCSDCEEFLFPPQDVCPHCWSSDLAWVEVNGTGELLTYSTIHAGVDPIWEEELPYTIAFVELDEGVFVFSNVVECPIEDLEMGLPVEVVFNELPGYEGQKFPQFRPVTEDS